MGNQQKREHDGKYAFDGRLDRICVCGHMLAHHAAGSPADCLFYSLPTDERNGWPGARKPHCACMKFRLSRKKQDAAYWYANIAQLHKQGDLACGRKWECSCGPCRVAKSHGCK
jgi:hypothetical protein